MRRLYLAAFACLVITACTQANKIDRAKFEKIYRAAKAVESCSLQDHSLVEYSKVFQIECSAAETAVSTQAERNMVDQFRTASQAIRLALVYKRDADIGKAENIQRAANEWEEGLAEIRQACEWYSAGGISHSSILVTAAEDLYQQLLIGSTYRR